MSKISRGLSTSCMSFMPKRQPKYLYPRVDQAKAQKNLDRKKYKEIVDAQELRKFWGKFTSS